MISLDSEFEDSPGPETWKKHGPLLADIKEPRCGLDSRSSVADSAEASTGIAQPSFGMQKPKLMNFVLSCQFYKWWLLFFFQVIILIGCMKSVFALH